LTVVREQKLRVLHIDDEDAQLVFAKTFLEDADPGLDVVSFSDPAELLDALDDSVDCVVSDYIMPGMDGMELCLRVKERASVPFILYTGRGSEVVAEAAFKRGVDDYVRKESDPSHYQLLAKRIRSQAATYRRLGEQRRYQERLEQLRGNLGLLSEANSLRGLAEATSLIVERVFGYSRCCFMVFRDGKMVPVYTNGQVELSRLDIGGVDSILQVVDEDGERVVVPLKLGDVHGAVVIGSPEGYCDQDESLLGTLGTLVSQSLHRVVQTEKIRASEEQFRSIVENVQDVIVLTRPEGSITYVSPSCRGVFGCAPGELMRRMWGDLVCDEDMDKLETFYAKSLRGEGGVIPEYRVRCGGGERWVSHSWSPIVKDGEVWQVVSAVNDITWRKNAETALQRSMGELEQTNKELNDFTHIVSHDLKAPLMTIESFSSFLLEDYGDRLGDAGQDYLSRVMTASQRMVALIDGLLTLSRVGRKHTGYTEVDVGRLVGEVLEDLGGQLDASGAVVTVGEMPVVVAQAVWMKQLLGNLVGNAIKFNESKPPRVEVGYRDAGDHHLFTVTDNGIGIPESQRHLLFRVFSRVPTEKHYPGTGAGLSICRKIVESMGGEIGVEGKEGFGSTFWFTLPKGRVPEGAAEVEAEAEALELQ
jgi:two-component system sensor kinase FixL